MTSQNVARIDLNWFELTSLSNDKNSLKKQNRTQHKNKQTKRAGILSRFSLYSKQSFKETFLFRWALLHPVIN